VEPLESLSGSTFMSELAVTLHGFTAYTRVYPSHRTVKPLTQVLRQAAMPCAASASRNRLSSSMSIALSSTSLTTLGWRVATGMSITPSLFSLRARIDAKSSCGVELGSFCAGKAKQLDR
jgi:hypothetical protein